MSLSQESPGSRHTDETNSTKRTSEIGLNDLGETAASGNFLGPTKKRVKVYPERANRIRAKKPKTKTGCKTCKIRRVKCGEEFPACLRCVKFGTECDGYNTSQPPPKQQVLLPRKQGNTIRIMPETAMFQDENEHQYFLFFRDDIVLDLSGTIPDNLWNFVVLRASVKEPALRYLSVAISALRKSQTYPYSSESLKHHRFAVSQYGRALKRIQSVLDTYRQEEAIRISLIASLLIFCFENTLGEHEAAVAHIKSALMLMQKRISHITRPYMQSRTGPSVLDLEHEVMDVFVRLDNTIMARIGGPSDEPKVSRLQISYSDDFKLPRRFQDAVEAKRYLEHLQFRSMPFLSHMPDYMAKGRAYEPYIPQKDLNSLTSQLDKFAIVFEPTLAETSADVDFHQFAAAATVRLQLLVTRVSLLRVAYGNLTIPPDEFVEQSLEIVDLSDKIVRDRRFRKTFVMSCGILPSLFVVLLVCPRREIREETIRILKCAAGRIEVVWDALAIARLGRRILDSEDQDRAALLSKDNFSILRVRSVAVSSEMMISPVAAGAG